jgi:pimeloyl-ACP methyl ester carboxylesterase
MPNRKGAEATRITTTPTEEWRSFKWADPQVLTFKARDGAEVYARLFTPEMLGAKRDPAAPGVVFVHGAGYAQNAHKYWSTYSREYMFHNLLVSRGYVVLDVDYRASSGYGRDWRTAIYPHMGGKDLDDIVDGAKFLVEKQKVNPKRIGVFGGSYGGFITLMAMFTSPDIFAAGAALRPVTDWGPLQSRVHGEHPQRAAVGLRGVPEELADLLRRGAERRPAHLPRHRGHQRALPGLGARGPTPHRAAQGELAARGLPGGEPRVRAGDQLGRRVQAHPEAVRGQPAAAARAAVFALG